MAERPRPENTWPRGRDLRRLGREAETWENLAERPRPEKTWPRGRDDREAETLEDLAETTETTGTWLAERPRP